MKVEFRVLQAPPTQDELTTRETLQQFHNNMELTSRWGVAKIITLGFFDPVVIVSTISYSYYWLSNMYTIAYHNIYKRTVGRMLGVWISFRRWLMTSTSSCRLTWPMYTYIIKNMFIKIVHTIFDIFTFCYQFISANSYNIVCSFIRLLCDSFS